MIMITFNICILILKKYTYSSYTSCILIRIEESAFISIQLNSLTKQKLKE